MQVGLYIRKIIQEKLWDLKEILIANLVKDRFDNTHKKIYASATKFEEMVAFLILENIKKSKPGKMSLKFVTKWRHAD